MPSNANAEQRVKALAPILLRAKFSFQRPTAPSTDAKPKKREMDAKFLPQSVAYDGPEQPGTIVIDTAQRFLYLVEAGGTAQRYGVGVGKEGFGWSGTNTDQSQSRMAVLVPASRDDQT